MSSRRFSGRAALAWGLAALAALPLAGCGPKACPLILSYALNVTIEHGAGAGECRYAIAVEQPNGTRADLTCDTASNTDDCTCWGGTLEGTYAVELHVAGDNRALDTQLAVVQAQNDACGMLNTQSLSWTVAPLEGAGGAGGVGGAGGAAP